MLTVKTYQYSKSTDIGEGKLEIIENNKMLSAETNQPAPCESSFSMFFTSFEHLLNMHGLPPIYSGWWFQPLWKILVSWDDYSQYMEK